jgi:hypothetical protein
MQKNAWGTNIERSISLPKREELGRDDASEGAAKQHPTVIVHVNTTGARMSMNKNCHSEG